MKNKIFERVKGFTTIEIFPVLLFMGIFMVLIILGFLIAFDFSVYFQWNKFSSLEEAYIRLNNIAGNMDTCINSGKDCSLCSQDIIDKHNMPFLISPYQSPNFRFNINTFLPGSNSCVINAVRVDANRTPVFSPKPYPPVSFDCGGNHIVLDDKISGVDLCRDRSGKRTMYVFGAYQ